jgi:hypothetical protein
MSDKEDSNGSEVLPPSLRLLRALVMLLMVVMIGGVITVVWLLVTRMPGAGGQLPPVLPATLTLPAGAKALAVTFGPGWVAVVTDQDHILIFDEGGVLRQDVVILPAP